MRYKALISYMGTNYCGWQNQPNALSVQEVIESKLSLMLRQKIPVIGCGRTDAGVHAKNYALHFDCTDSMPENFVFKLNQFLPKDISVLQMAECDEGFHARFDASRRSYTYYLHGNKDPFDNEQSFYFHQLDKLNLKDMNTACDILLSSKEFAPFCKSNSDANTMNCDIFICKWDFLVNVDRMEFHISADRFLRGMVRLIVGMMINVGIGKISIETLKIAMNNQSIIPHSWSVPAHGLFFENVEY